MRTSIVGKILMVLLFASVIGGLIAGPALGRNGDRGQGPQPRGYYDDRGRHDNRGWRGDRGRRVYRPYGYYNPVPVPSPGVRIFLPFPFDIR